MTFSPIVLFWIGVGGLGLPLCVYVLRRKRQYLALVPRNEPPGLLARLLISEEIDRLLMLIAVLGIGVLAVIGKPFLIVYLLVAIEVLIVVPSLLWLRYEQRMTRLRKRGRVP